MHLGFREYEPLSASFIPFFGKPLTEWSRSVQEWLDQGGGLSAERRVFCFHAQGGANNPPATSKSTRGHEEV